MARGGAAAAGEAAADGGAVGPAGARRHRAPFPPATQAAAMIRAAVPLDALRVAVREGARAAAWSAAVPEQHVEQPSGAAKTTSEMSLLDGLCSPLSQDAGGGADTAAFSGDGEPAKFDEWGESDGEEGMGDPDELTYECAPPPAVAGCAPPPGAVCAASAEQGLRMMRWRASARPLRPALLLHRDPPALLTAGAAGMGMGQQQRRLRRAEEGCGKPVEVALLGLRAFGDVTLLSAAQRLARVPTAQRTTIGGGGGAAARTAAAAAETHASWSGRSIGDPHGAVSGDAWRKRTQHAIAGAGRAAHLQSR
eukprot:gene8143-4039_t